MTTGAISMAIASIINTDPEKVSVWGKTIRDIGVPILMLIAMSFAMYQGALWIGQYILIPTLHKNEELVSGQIESNKALLQSLNQITEHIRIQTENNKSNTDALAKMTVDISAIRTATESTAAEKTRIIDITNKNQALLEEIKKKIP